MYTHIHLRNIYIQVAAEAVQYKRRPKRRLGLRVLYQHYILHVIDKHRETMTSIIEQIWLYLCRCCTSCESRYCWQRVGCPWSLKCHVMAMSSSHLHRFASTSMKSSVTRMCVSLSDALRKVCQSVTQLALVKTSSLVMLLFHSKHWMLF